MSKTKSLKYHFKLENRYSPRLTPTALHEKRSVWRCFGKTPMFFISMSEENYLSHIYE